MSYMNDPREMVIRPESGVTLEQDNRVEEMYHWGAMVVDLCDLPVEEYMKPMTVIGLGGGDIPETMYTLNFEIDGVNVAQFSLKSGDPIPFSVNGEKDGRNFLGWFNNGTQYYEGALMPSKTLKLTAKYTCDVNFIFVEDGVEREVSAYTVNYNSKLTLTSIPSTENPGFEFLGWNPPTTEAVKVHTTFKAMFESITYTVVWNGYVDGPIIAEYKYGDALEQPKDPEKEGYTFNKWDKQIPSNVESNLIFNAVFDVNQYNIDYNIEWNGEKTPFTSFTANYGTTIPTAKTITEKGYTFSEWESEYKGKTVPAFNVEYISKKTVNSYILAYYVNDNLIKEDTYEYLSKITLYEYTPEEGYEATKWEGLPENLIMPYNNVSAYCTTEIMRFTVVFIDQNGNELSRNEKIPYGTEIDTILPESPEGYHYTYDETIDGVVKENLTINVNVSIGKYRVNINDESVLIEYGTNIENYIRENYVPDEGYYLNIKNITHETVPGEHDKASVEFTFEPNVWVLSYSTDGADENISGSKKVAFGTKILSELPSTEEMLKEGYIFNGWFDEEKQQLSADDTMPNNNLTVFGTYDIKSFEVSIFDEDNKIFNKSYVYKTKLSSVLNDEAIVEYVTAQSASGQTVSFVLNGESVNEEMEITSNIDIYVEKTPNEYLLTFMNGNEIISESLVKFGETIKYPPMENKTEGGVEYVFVWEGKSYNGEPMPAEDLKIVGNYQEKAEAPIYYGSFVILKDDYSSDNVSKYFNENDLNTSYYNTITVDSCVGKESAVEFMYPPYEPFVSMSRGDYMVEKERYYEPSVMLIPVKVIEKYNISLIDSMETPIWEKFITDKKEITINGEKFYFYVYRTDSLVPTKLNQTIPTKLKLTEK